MNKEPNKSVLLVISGPTCAGKDTVIRELMKRNPNMRRLVTTNSRSKRPDEKEGIDYYFVSKVEFEKLIAQDAFFEWVEYRGHYRGGQKKHVDEALKSGKDVIWRPDVRGGKNVYHKVKELYPRSAFVFLTAPISVLKSRMERRGMDSVSEQEWNIRRAKWEVRQGKSYDYVLENAEGKLSETVDEIQKIIDVTRNK